MAPVNFEPYSRGHDRSFKILVKSYQIVCRLIAMASNNRMLKVEIVMIIVSSSLNSWIVKFVSGNGQANIDAYNIVL